MLKKRTNKEWRIQGKDEDLENKVFKGGKGSKIQPRGIRFSPSTDNCCQTSSQPRCRRCRRVMKWTELLIGPSAWQLGQRVVNGCELPWERQANGDCQPEVLDRSPQPWRQCCFSTFLSFLCLLPLHHDK